VNGMSDILAEVRSLPFVLVLALTGCGATHHPPEAGRLARGRGRGLLQGAQPAGAAGAAEQLPDRRARGRRGGAGGSSGARPHGLSSAIRRTGAARAAERLRRARRAILVELLGQIRAARRQDLRGVQRAIRRLTPLNHAATAAASAAGLHICGHELDRGIAELPA